LDTGVGGWAMSFSDLLSLRVIATLLCAFDMSDTGGTRCVLPGGASMNEAPAERVG